MVYVFLADGFEEIEALAPVDVLRRAGLEVKTVGVTGNTVTGSHKIPVVCDIEIKDASFENLSGIVLPGGMPGTLNLEKNKDVQRFIDYAFEKGLVIGAICAAPSILGHKGILKGKAATCFDGFEKDLDGAIIKSVSAVTDGNIITSRGAGAAYDFAFALLSALLGESEKSDKLCSSMHCIRGDVYER